MRMVLMRKAEQKPIPVVKVAQVLKRMMPGKLFPLFRVKPIRAFLVQWRVFSAPALSMAESKGKLFRFQPTQLLPIYRR